MKLDGLDKVFFLNKPLRKVMDGHLFDLIFGWTLRVAALAMAIVLVVVSVKLWHGTFYRNMAMEAMGASAPPPPVWVAVNPGFLRVLYTAFAQIVWVAIFFAFANILWLRSMDILREEEDPDYNAMPTLVFLLKAAGECYAVYLLGIFTIGALSTWILGKSDPVTSVTHALKLGGLLPYLPANPFLLGLILLVVGPILAVLLVLCVYAVVEVLGSLVSVALSAEKLLHIAKGKK